MKSLTGEIRDLIFEFHIFRVGEKSRDSFLSIFWPLRLDPFGPESYRSLISFYFIFSALRISEKFFLSFSFLFFFCQTEPRFPFTHIHADRVLLIKILLDYEFLRVYSYRGEHHWDYIFFFDPTRFYSATETPFISATVWYVHNFLFSPLMYCVYALILCVWINCCEQNKS